MKDSNYKERARATILAPFSFGLVIIVHLCTWTAIRLPVGQLHHARLGVTAKTVANHKANVAAALRWFGKEYNLPSRGVALSAEWAVLRCWERRQLDDLVGDATTDQRAEPKKEPLIPSTMVCRVDERPKGRRHGGQL